jgi:hypothetical protein
MASRISASLPAGERRPETSTWHKKPRGSLHPVGVTGSGLCRCAMISASISAGTSVSIPRRLAPVQAFCNQSGGGAVVRQIIRSRPTLAGACHTAGETTTSVRLPHPTVDGSAGTGKAAAGVGRPRPTFDARTRTGKTSAPVWSPFLIFDARARTGEAAAPVHAPHPAFDAWTRTDEAAAPVRPHF